MKRHRVAKVLLRKSPYSVQIQENMDQKKISHFDTFSKSRLVPATKKYTMPKLELFKNFILSNLISIVYNALSEVIVVANYFCWSNLSIALAWIKIVNEEYKVFIQN